jgi:LPS O-antigen subunit length determinant protein (WzzB/FepE family)
MELTHNMVFIKSNRRLIALFILSGLALAVIYLAVAPKTYQAVGLIKMAQLNGVDIESPEIVKIRMALAGTYSESLIASCNEHASTSPEQFALNIKFETLKKSTSEIELKLPASSVTLAQKCAQDVFELVRQQQEQLIDERLLGRAEIVQVTQASLAKDLQTANSIAINRDSNLGFMSRLERINALKAKLDSLAEEKIMAHLHPAKLIAPIYAANKPIAPKPVLLMLLGVLLGLTLGILFAWFRQNLHQAGSKK